MTLATTLADHMRRLTGRSTKELHAALEKATGKPWGGTPRDQAIKALAELRFKAGDAPATPMVTVYDLTNKPDPAKKAKPAKQPNAPKTPKAKEPKAPRAAKPKPTKKGERDPRLPAIGGTIEKVYKGATLKVVCHADHFRFDGDDYPSLTAIALKVTGAKTISGPFFFGIAPRKAVAAK